MNGQNLQLSSLRLSNNGLYLINEERIYFAKENKSYLLEDISPLQWIDILSENTQYSIKNKIVPIEDLVKYQRKVTYQILESFPLDDKTKLLMEYEWKFGKTLLTESSVLVEDWFADAFNWVKGKVEAFGEFAIKTGKDLVTCIGGPGKFPGRCSPLFDDFREMLYSPVGVAIDVFLSVTGFGKIGLIIVWGIMVLWDIYALISGTPGTNWLDLIIDLLGLASGVFAKSVRVVAKETGLLAKAVGKTPAQIIEMGLKNPKTSSLFQKIGEVIKGAVGGAKSILQSAGKFLVDKLGMTWVDSVINKASAFFSKILDAFTVPNAYQPAVKKAAVAGGITAGVNAAVTPPGNPWEKANFDTDFN